MRSFFLRTLFWGLLGAWASVAGVPEKTQWLEIRSTPLPLISTISNWSSEESSRLLRLLDDGGLFERRPSVLARLKSILFLLDSTPENPMRGPGVDRFLSWSASCQKRFVLEFLEQLLGEESARYTKASVSEENALLLATSNLLRDYPASVPAKAQFSLKQWSGGQTFFRNHLSGTQSGAEADRLSEQQLKTTGLLNGAGILSIFPSEPTIVLRRVHSIVQTALMGSQSEKKQLLDESMGCELEPLALYELQRTFDLSVLQELVSAEAMSEDSEFDSVRRWLQVTETSGIEFPQMPAAFVDFGYLDEGYTSGLAKNPWTVLMSPKKGLWILEALAQVYRYGVKRYEMISPRYCESVNRVLNLQIQAGYQLDLELLAGTNSKAAEDTRLLISSLIAGMSTQRFSKKTGESVVLATACLTAFRSLGRLAGDSSRRIPAFSLQTNQSVFSLMRFDQGSGDIYLSYKPGSALACSVNRPKRQQSIKFCSGKIRPMGSGPRTASLVTFHNLR